MHRGEHVAEILPIVAPRPGRTHVRHEQEGLAVFIPAKCQYLRRPGPGLAHRLQAIRLHRKEIIRHILNTDGILRFPDHQYEMVRLGIGLYGIPTLGAGYDDKLRPVSSLHSVIIQIREWEAGTTIGYGRHGVLTRPSRIATIPIGYADGFNRHLGCGHGEVWINGKRVPTVGNICMDLFMADVTDVECAVGDKVEIFGEHISAQDVADRLQTIPYEVLTSVSSRVKRIYYSE